MTAALAWLFTSTTPPRGACLGWRADLIVPEVVSDLVIAASFLGVLIGMIWFLRRRPDLIAANRLLAFLLAAFVIAVATLRLLDVLAIWYPISGVHALAKIATALVFVGTIAAGWRLLPALARAPSPR